MQFWFKLFMRRSTMVSATPSSVYISTQIPFQGGFCSSFYKPLF
jgi:hypothetical protein